MVVVVVGVIMMIMGKTITMTCSCSPEDTFVISIQVLVNLARLLAHLTYTGLVEESVNIWEYYWVKISSLGSINLCHRYMIVCSCSIPHKWKIYVSIKNFRTELNMIMKWCCWWSQSSSYPSCSSSWLLSYPPLQKRLILFQGVFPRMNQTWSK